MNKKKTIPFSKIYMKNPRLESRNLMLPRLASEHKAQVISDSWEIEIREIKKVD